MLDAGHGTTYQQVHLFRFDAGRQTDGDPADYPAEAGQGAQAEKAGQACRDLSASRGFKPGSRDRLTPCGAVGASASFPQAGEINVSEHHQQQLERHMAWFEGKLPPRAARLMGWLRQPSSRYARIPLALLLIVGGVFSFLPVLGLWMLPFGLVLFAQDVPVLQKPTARTLGWIERKWIERQRRKNRR